MTLQGKGFFIWKVRDCEGGSPQRIVAAAQASGYSHVLVKVADGPYRYNIDQQTKMDLVPTVIDALKQRGIQAWGWQYVYGYNPLEEARIAIQRIQQLDLDGFVVDAEEQYKEPGKANAARRYMQTLRAAAPNIPIALSSYRFPTYHPQLPWQAFLDYCDYNMPQVYWEQAHNPGAQLRRCVKEFQALNPIRPVIPTGPAYKWNGWRPTDSDLREFLDTARDLQLPAVNFFSWDECRRDLNNLWELIGGYPFGRPQPEQPKDLPERFIHALNSHNPDEVIKLYRPDAVQITAARTVQGLAAVRAWYEFFLGSQMPQSTFSLTGSSGRGSSRHFTWRAASPRGTIPNGSDTIGIIDGKIMFHYTSFSIKPA